VANRSPDGESPTAVTASNESGEISSFQTIVCWASSLVTEIPFSGERELATSVVT
jgi:hypothetical protein